MNKVIIKPLPHSPTVEAIRDPQIRFVMMQFNENIKSLKSQLEGAQKAIQELQKEVK